MEQEQPMPLRSLELRPQRREGNGHGRRHNFKAFMRVVNHHIRSGGIRSKSSIWINPVG